MIDNILNKCNEPMRNICIVAGARPNFIKVAPIIRAIERVIGERRDVGYRLENTGGESPVGIFRRGYGCDD